MGTTTYSLHKNNWTQSSQKSEILVLDTSTVLDYLMKTF